MVKRDYGFGEKVKLYPTFQYEEWTKKIYIYIYIRLYYTRTHQTHCTIQLHVYTCTYENSKELTKYLTNNDIMIYLTMAIYY